VLEPEVEDVLVEPDPELESGFAAGADSDFVAEEDEPDDAPDDSFAAPSEPDRLSVR
jgi:hypothetical protein